MNDERIEGRQRPVAAWLEDTLELWRSFADATNLLALRAVLDDASEVEAPSEPPARVRSETPPATRAA